MLKINRVSIKYVFVGLLSVLPAIALASAPAAQGIKNWGLINSQANSHIQATEAWKIEEGSHRVVVAVIDTGIDSTHPALASNLWHDLGHEPGQIRGLSGRESGLSFGAGQNSAPVYGWNFVTDQPNPSDDHGHGTHIAGIIGAVTDHRNGISGVAHRVSIMPIKYYSTTSAGSDNLKNMIRAIRYAIDHGAQIINYSGGGADYSAEEYAIIKEAEQRGILFVAAAGNEHQDTDVESSRYFPSSYGLNNILSVAATDINNQLLSFSNWGKTTVDVAAPGGNILSTFPHHGFKSMSGTSQATAFVTGMAALLLAQQPTLKPAQIKELIMNSVDSFPQLKNKVAAGGRVNAYRALLSLQKKVQDLSRGAAGFLFDVLKSGPRLAPVLPIKTDV